MAEKHAATSRLAEEYRRASKKRKGDILDTLVALKRRIVELQRRLYELASLKESIRRREVCAPDLDDIYDESTNVAFDDILT